MSQAKRGDVETRSPSVKLVIGGRSRHSDKTSTPLFLSFARTSFGDYR